MNFLAHIYLSGDDEELIVGNFIADHVKGKQVLTYSQGVQKGIQLHRAIDTYTDSHPMVHETKARLREQFRKYAPVIADIYYDHFLALHWEQFHPDSLEDYTTAIYHLLKKYNEVIPERTQRMLMYMEQQNWLLNYRNFEGMQRVLTGMSRRTSFDSKMEEATDALRRNYDEYSKDFFSFFPELQRYVKGLTGI